jgi:hypothetical protein
MSNEQKGEVTFHRKANNAMGQPDLMERRALARLTQQALELDGQLEPSVFPIEPIKLTAK